MRISLSFLVEHLSSLIYVYIYTIFQIFPIQDFVYKISYTKEVFVSEEIPRSVRRVCHDIGGSFLLRLVKMTRRACVGQRGETEFWRFTCYTFVSRKNKVPVTVVLSFLSLVPRTSATFSSAKEFVFPKIPFKLLPSLERANDFPSILLFFLFLLQRYNALTFFSATCYFAPIFLNWPYFYKDKGTRENYRWEREKRDPRNSKNESKTFSTSSLSPSLPQSDPFILCLVHFSSFSSRFQQET